MAAVTLVDRDGEVLETDGTLQVVEEGGVGLEVGSGFFHTDNYYRTEKRSSRLQKL